MKILLVEDRPEHLRNYKYAINDYHSELEIIVARSFGDLQKKLLTQDYDTAIVDMNLDKWPGSGHFGVSNGKQICDLIERTKNFKSLGSSVFLYSADDEIDLGDAPPAYTIAEKFIGPNVVDRFQSAILKKMKDKYEIEAPVTQDAFDQLHHSQKNRHYKNILNKDKGQARFAIQEDVLWASDMATTEYEPETVCKRDGDPELEFMTATSQYINLDQSMAKTEKLPAVFWNYRYAELLRTQREYFRKSDVTNDTLNLFFSISFAHGLAYHMLGDADHSSLIELANRKDELMLREIQCKMVDLMAEQSDREATIRKTLEKVSKKTNYELVEYFDGSLDSYDKTTDVANVRLTSRLNPNKRYNREFSYRRLTANGIKYKETPFIYCVSDHAANVSGYFEAQ